MPNTNQNELTYIVQYHLHLHTQKEDNVVKLFLDPTSLTGFDRFGLSHNDPHNFGKFGATANSGTESCFALQFFPLACSVNFSNQLMCSRPERARNLDLFDSK